MPLVAYDSSDDEDSQGEEKIDSLKGDSSVPGKGSKVNQVVNKSIDGKLLPNQLTGNGTQFVSSGSAVGLVGDDLVGSSSIVDQRIDDDDDLEPSPMSSNKLLGKLPDAGKKVSPTSMITSGLSNIVVVDKKSKRIKVVIPSLDEMDYASEEEEEEVGPKRKITPAGGCSLSSFLPKPKNAPPRYNSNNLFSSVSSPSSSTSLNVSVKSAVASLVPHSVSRPKTNIPTKRPQNVLVESDEADDTPTNFFSFSDSSKSHDNRLDIDVSKLIPIIIPQPEIELTSNEMMKRKIEDDESSTSSYYKYPQPAQSSSKRHHPSTSDIHDPDFKKFVASKFGEEPADQINIVEVNVSSYLASDTELIKSISMETAPETVKGPAPSALAKRKNQITYLAYQAKQRELDLKNQAANNRFTKAQTRAKYGF